MNHSNIIETLFCCTICCGIRHNKPLFLQYGILSDHWKNLAAKVKSEENTKLKSDVIKQLVGK